MCVLKSQSKMDANKTAGTGKVWVQIPTLETIISLASLSLTGHQGLSINWACSNSPHVVGSLEDLIRDHLETASGHCLLSGPSSLKMNTNFMGQQWKPSMFSAGVIQKLKIYVEFSRRKYNYLRFFWMRSLLITSFFYYLSQRIQ